MAKKSKGFADLLRQERNEDIEGRSINQLKRKIKKSPLGQKNAGMVTTPKGMAKMSEVLQAFVDPYLDDAKNHSQREMLFDLAAMAWNLSYMAKNERQLAIKEMIGKLSNHSDSLTQRKMRESVEELISRKLELFPHDRRFIAEFHLEEMGDSFHLSVASAMMDQD
jgi:hypothetical protein